VAQVPATHAVRLVAAAAKPHLINPCNQKQARAPRALLLAPHLSYRTAAYHQAASLLGIDLTIASTSEVNLTSANSAGIYIDPGAPESALATLLDASTRTPFDGVLATDDAMVELSGQIARELGFLHNAPDAARLSRRKDLARQCQRSAGIAAPQFQTFELADASRIARCSTAPSWPAVVKPLAWSGSRGVMRVNGPQEFVSACERLSLMLDAEPPLDDFERTHALVEGFLPGVEVAVEALLRNGELVPLAVFDKPDPLDGPFFEETYYITPSRHGPHLESRIYEVLGTLCAAYGLRHGPVHAEFRIDGEDIWPLEVAARTIGGDCARLLRFGAGHGLEELVLANAVGRSLDTRLGDEAGGVLMLPTPGRGVLRRVEGVLAAQAVRYVDEVVISVNAGHELVPLPEGSSYLGFVFARGPTPAAVESALREAHAHLRVVIAPTLPVMIGLS
jgi:biotin carboxylase